MNRRIFVIQERFQPPVSAGCVLLYLYQAEAFSHVSDVLLSHMVSLKNLIILPVKFNCSQNYEEK